MDRKTNTALNWMLGFVIGYLVASRSLNYREALKSALLSANITAAIAWFVYEEPEPVPNPETDEMVPP